LHEDHEDEHDHTDDPAGGFAKRERTVTPDETLAIDVAAHGGSVAILTPSDD
jgi:hypothetical protein